MKNRQYFLVVTDSRGLETRRSVISRASLQLATGLGAVLVLLLAGVALHGLGRAADARETPRLRRETLTTQTLVQELENALPKARTALAQANMSFHQLWKKSDLGVDTAGLGVGPLEGGLDDRLPTPEDPDAALGRVMTLDPLVLPLELAQVRRTSGRLQRVIGETLEYFRDAERLLSNTPSVRPVRTHITSRFGKRRDPMHGAWVMHKGLDFGGWIGEPVYAPADGVVIWSGPRGGYGQTVVIDHGYGLQTHFAHLSSYRVRRGQRVSRGDPIALMGNTGRSTGPHLHYEVRRLGAPLDPMSFILD